MIIYFIVFGVMLLSFIIQKVLTNRFEKYSKVGISLSGAEIVERMMQDNDIDDVKVMAINGQLTDHYNPQEHSINLSQSVFNQRNIAAAAIAAHETGHCIQHAQGYGPLKLRTALVPVVSFANRTVSWVLLLGVLLIETMPILLDIGIALFAITTFFSIVTLPVEINASRRAIAWLEQSGIATYETLPMAKDALKWAAYTYVIAALGSLATLFYYISLSNNRRY
ncbi:MAG: zinc metallopeptidase [Candidatus Cryptobacteroides sp.]|jgi:Zn-dependent membrane protease YugP|nr:zinc metallopeptidase [Rikenellaceae bacterium]